MGFFTLSPGADSVCTLMELCPLSWLGQLWQDLVGAH